MTKKNFTLIDILDKGKEILHKTFKMISPNYEDIESKGGFGHFIKREVFGIEQNSDSNPDFENIGVKLKVTPFKMIKNTVSAKERLVLNIINYVNEANETFYTSSFWKKNSMIYILFYLWEYNKQKEDFIIMYDYLLDFLNEDLAIIKRDWEIIHNKIVTGKAHEISEADTMYLGACTKGANNTTLRDQPFSNIKAKQRAYCLKQSYMTHLLRTKIVKDIKSVKLIKDAVELEKNSFEDIIKNKINPYLGWSRRELISWFNLEESSAKNINELILAKMLGIEGKISKTEEFIKANIIPKTIRIEINGKINEHMSFPPFKFEEIVEETWEESQIRDYFESTKFMFVVFRHNGKDYIFEKVKFWNMPTSIIDRDLKDVWLHTKEVIRTGNIVKKVISNKKTKSGYTYITNFIKSSQSHIIHIRPHAKDFFDTYPLPVSDKYTGLANYMKQCFWLDSTYVLKIIEE